MLLRSLPTRLVAAPPYFRQASACLLVCLIWLLLPPPLRAEEARWQPEKTWVFAVGILNFDDPDYDSFPEENREDAAMLQVLRDEGVPREQMVFIKNERATKAEIVQRLAAFLKRAPEDALLLFYYTGHGTRDVRTDERQVEFVTYDTKASSPARSPKTSRPAPR